MAIESSNLQDSSRDTGSPLRTVDLNAYSVQYWRGWLAGSASHEDPPAPARGPIRPPNTRQQGDALQLGS